MAGFIWVIARQVQPQTTGNRNLIRSKRANMEIDAAASIRSVNYMVNHICEPRCRREFGWKEERRGRRWHDVTASSGEPLQSARILKLPVRQRSSLRNFTVFDSLSVVREEFRGP